MSAGGKIIAELLMEWLRGYHRGQQEIAARIGVRLLCRQDFGPIPYALRETISSLPADQLEQFCDDVLGFKSLDDVTAWLARQPEPVESWVFQERRAEH